MIQEVKVLEGPEREAVAKLVRAYADVMNAAEKVVSASSKRNAEGHLEVTKTVDTSAIDTAFETLKQELHQMFPDLVFNTLHINTDFFPMRYFLQMHDDVPEGSFKIWQF